MNFPPINALILNRSTNIVLAQTIHKYGRIEAKDAVPIASIIYSVYTDGIHITDIEVARIIINTYLLPHSPRLLM